jgi:hypothetical protein
MLPGLDSIPAAAVLDRLSLLKYRNARGSHTFSDKALYQVHALPDAEGRTPPTVAVVSTR